MTVKEQDRILQLADQIRERRARRKFMKAVNTMLTSTQPHGKLRYFVGTPGIRCEAFYNCCYAQGRCELKSGHKGPHVQNHYGSTIIYLTMHDRVKQEISITVSEYWKKNKLVRNILNKWKRHKKEIQQQTKGRK